MENQPIFKAIIVDDEQPARAIIAHYLIAFPNIELAGECANGFEALKMIKELKPDVLFLDVQMPKINGLELLEVIDNAPAVIFTTAYDQYALKAFELNAVDYLLKPFSKDRFYAAVNKVIEKIKAGQTSPIISVEALFSDPSEKLTRIVVKNGSNITVIPISDIYFIEAQEDYVMIHSSKGRLMKNQTMNYLEQHLPQNQFIRIHRSYIVNIEKIEKLEPYDKDTYTAIIPPAHKLRISRTGYKKLKDTLRF
jgi:two-component system LytT family response regulator